MALFVGLGLCLFLHLWLGSGMPPAAMAKTFLDFDPDDYGHYVILYQRLPRALIALHVGAVLACSGAVLQGLVRNPLAAPSTLGISGGAMVFVVAGAVLGLGTAAQGIAALAGGAAGAGAAMWVARLAGLGLDPRGMVLILAGALVTMLCMGVANALLLSDPALRTAYLGWISGDINHVYADRLTQFWWIGWLAIGVLMVLAKPLTLIMLGTEKAASAGVDVRRVSLLGLGASVIAASSATAICGPVGFVGLVVPHLVRPFTGPALWRLMPVSAVAGGLACLIADLIAREAFSPYSLHSGVVLDLAGGLVFALLIRRHYLGAQA
ncbi:FecCD family ABC transporter permease [Paracoccus methylarcula]|nr:iron ABC transporter permease [Paracoccus methylarcula]